MLPQYKDARWTLNDERLSAARYDVPAQRQRDAGNEELAAFYGSLATWFTFADPPLHTGSTGSSARSSCRA